MPKSLLIMEEELWRHKEPRETESDLQTYWAPYRDKVLIDTRGLGLHTIAKVN